MRRALLAAALATACTPNPRREMPAVIAAVAASLAHDGAGVRCIQRQIAPVPVESPGRRPQPPPNSAEFTGVSTFRGGGGVSGATIAGVPVGGSPACVRLTGPVINRDGAMMIVESSHRLWRYRLRKGAGGWAVVARHTVT